MQSLLRQCVPSEATWTTFRPLTSRRARGPNATRTCSDMRVANSVLANRDFTMTGTPAAYHPAGSLLRADPIKRRDYDAWQPE